MGIRHGSYSWRRVQGSLHDPIHDVIPQAAEDSKAPYKKIGKIKLLSIFLAVAWYLLIIFAVCYIMPQSAIAQEMSSQNGLVSANAIEIAFRSPLMGKVLF